MGVPKGKILVGYAQNFTLNIFSDIFGVLISFLFDFSYFSRFSFFLHPFPCCRSLNRVCSCCLWQSPDKGMLGVCFSCFFSSMSCWHYFCIIRYTRPTTVSVGLFALFLSPHFLFSFLCFLNSIFCLEKNSKSLANMLINLLGQIFFVFLLFISDYIF